MNVTLITGPMKSGKTTALINIFNKCEGRVLAVKPKIDIRWSNKYITTHNGAKIKATSVESISEISAEDYDCIFVDEGFMFNDLQMILEWNIPAYVASITYDYNQNMFPSIARIWDYTTKINLTAVCETCGDVAIHTKKIKNNSRGIINGDVEIDIGGDDKYYPVCDGCY